MNRKSAQATRISFSANSPAPPSYVALSELHGVQLLLDDRDPLAALRCLGDTLASLSDRRTVVALGIPGDREDIEICDALGHTLAWADAYVLYDMRDLRGRTPREMPQLVCEELPLDRICVLASNPADALRRAWRQVQPGDRLVLIGDAADEALARLPEPPHPVDGEVALLRDLLAREVGGAG